MLTFKIQLLRMAKFEVNTEMILLLKVNISGNGMGAYIWEPTSLAFYLPVLTV